MAFDRDRMAAGSGKLYDADGAVVDVTALIARLSGIMQSGDEDLRTVHHDWSAILDGKAYIMEEFREGIAPDAWINLSLRTPGLDGPAIHITDVEIFSTQVYGRFTPYRAATINSGTKLWPVNLNRTAPIAETAARCKRNVNLITETAGPGGICGNRRVVSQYQGVLAPDETYVFQLQNKHATNDADLWMRVLFHEMDR